MVNVEEVYLRFKRAFRIESDKEMAELFGISQPDFANRKKRGTLLPLIIDNAIHRNVNLHWLLIGHGKVYVDEGSASDPNVPPEITDLLDRAKLVLMSKNPIAFDALQRNINYFAYAIEKEGELDEMKVEMAEMRDEISSLRELLKKCIPKEDPDDDPGEAEAVEGRPGGSGRDRVA